MPSVMDGDKPPQVRSWGSMWCQVSVVEGEKCLSQGLVSTCLKLCGSTCVYFFLSLSSIFKNHFCVYFVLFHLSIYLFRFLALLCLYYFLLNLPFFIVFVCVYFILLHLSFYLLHFYFLSFSCVYFILLHSPIYLFYSCVCVFGLSRSVRVALFIFAFCSRFISSLFFFFLSFYFDSIRTKINK